MIIPSIDLQGGSTVQLVGGAEKAIDAGDPRPLATSFGRTGEIAVIDLDAAMGKGEQSALIEDLLPLARCRIGGGIRDVETARRWLDKGAAKVILGTAATPEILRELPRDRVIAALDAVDGEIVIKGWKEKTGQRVEDRIAELAPYVGGFLTTFVEREGRLVGVDLDRVRLLVERAGDAKVTIAGGVQSAQEVAAIDEIGADAQVGMALYTGALEVADVLAAMLRSDRPDGLWPTVVTDDRGIAMGLAYSDAESLREALRSGTGVYHSRRRGLWRKGESSGNTQQLLSVALDCDRDALCFRVEQQGRFLPPAAANLLRRRQRIERVAGNTAVPARRTHRPVPTPTACSPIRSCWPPSSAKRPVNWPPRPAVTKSFGKPPTSSTSRWWRWPSAASRWRKSNANSTAALVSPPAALATPRRTSDASPPPQPGPTTPQAQRRSRRGGPRNRR